MTKESLKIPSQWCKYPKSPIDLAYLEIQDNGPHQTQDNGWFPISNAGGIDVDQFDLSTKDNKHMDGKLLC